MSMLWLQFTHPQFAYLFVFLTYQFAYPLFLTCCELTWCSSKMSPQGTWGYPSCIMHLFKCLIIGFPLRCGVFLQFVRNDVSWHHLLGITSDWSINLCWLVWRNPDLNSSGWLVGVGGSGFCLLLCECAPESFDEEFPISFFYFPG